MCARRERVVCEPAVASSRRRKAFSAGLGLSLASMLGQGLGGQLLYEQSNMELEDYACGGLYLTVFVRLAIG